MTTSQFPALETMSSSLQSTATPLSKMGLPVLTSLTVHLMSAFIAVVHSFFAVGLGVGDAEGGFVGGGPAGSSFDSPIVGGLVGDAVGPLVGGGVGGSWRDSSSFSHSQHLSRQTLIQASCSELDKSLSVQSLVPSEPLPCLQSLRQSFSFSRSHLRSWSRSGKRRSSLSFSQHLARQPLVQLSDDSLQPFLLRQVLTHFCSAGRSQWSLRWALSTTSASKAALTPLARCLRLRLL
mmetsp:Transcript_3019/g.6971  ORF Transcript_3019/g.6971 Transcript_3019/m.6971 type:complete len:236 (-) Transcript_3019:238-945(-)